MMAARKNSSMEERVSIIKCVFIAENKRCFSGGVVAGEIAGLKIMKQE